jgi:hypothetical protein
MPIFIVFFNKADFIITACYTLLIIEPNTYKL